MTFVKTTDHGLVNILLIPMFRIEYSDAEKCWLVEGQCFRPIRHYFTLARENSREAAVGRLEEMRSIRPRSDITMTCGDILVDFAMVSSIRFESGPASTHTIIVCIDGVDVPVWASSDKEAAESRWCLVSSFVGVDCSLGAQEREEEE